MIERGLTRCYIRERIVSCQIGSGVTPMSFYQPVVGFVHVHTHCKSQMILTCFYLSNVIASNDNFSEIKYFIMFVLAF